jgi:hypothetical protein
MKKIGRKGRVIMLGKETTHQNRTKMKKMKMMNLEARVKMMIF